MSKEHRAMAESQADTRGSQIQDLKVREGPRQTPGAPRSRTSRYLKGGGGMY